MNVMKRLVMVMAVVVGCTGCETLKRMVSYESRTAGNTSGSVTINIGEVSQPVRDRPAISVQIGAGRVSYDSNGGALEGATANVEGM